MLSIQDVRSMTASMTLEAFERQLGPFVLVHKPPSPERAALSMALGADPTQPTNSTGDALNALLSFDDLVLATLPPLKRIDALTVGRLADNELVIDDPSVSKNHARLRWADGTATLEAFETQNGTRINDVELRGSAPLADKDTIAFGAVVFTYLTTRTFFVRVGQVRETTGHRNQRLQVPPLPSDPT